MTVALRSCEGLRIGECGVLSEELQLSCTMSGGELLQDQPAEQAREHAHWEEEAGPASDPAFTIERHTQLAMERPRSAAETATPMEALEIIRRMAVRFGDDQIASVLNRRGYSTGKGKRWNQSRVTTARRNHSIAGQKRISAQSGENEFE